MWLLVAFFIYSALILVLLTVSKNCKVFDLLACSLSFHLPCTRLCKHIHMNHHNLCTVHNQRGSHEILVYIHQYLKQKQSPYVILDLSIRPQNKSPMQLVPSPVYPGRIIRAAEGSHHICNFLHGTGQYLQKMAELSPQQNIKAFCSIWRGEI